MAVNPQQCSVFNAQMVGIGGSADGSDLIAVMRPKPTMTAEEALVLAAWLAVLADPMGDDFQVILDRVRNL